MINHAFQTGPRKVGLGRSNVVAALAVLAFLCWIIWAGAHGGWTATEKSARVLGFAIAGVFAVPLVMMLWALPRFLRPRYIVVDQDGLGITHGRQRVTVPWSSVLAVGIGYEQAPAERPHRPTTVDELKDAAKDYLTDRASEALQISGKRRIVLEIYPTHPGAVGQVPRLRPYWTEQPPPAAGLPAQAWRFPLPPVVSIGEAVARAVHGVAPQRWLGWFPRPPRPAG
jgi:membrane protein YdbS with pleckstrin-like domain